LIVARRCHNIIVDHRFKRSGVDAVIDIKTFNYHVMEGTAALFGHTLKSDFMVISKINDSQDVDILNVHCFKVAV